MVSIHFHTIYMQRLSIPALKYFAGGLILRPCTRNKLINDNCIVTLPPLQFPLCILAKQHGNVIIVNVIKTQQDFPLDLRNTFSTLYTKYSVGIKVSSFHAYWSLDIFKYTCPLLYYGRDNLFSYILVSLFNPYGALYLDQMIKIFVDWVIA